MNSPADAEQLLEFWFGDHSEPLTPDAIRQRWFQSSADFDSLCRTRFLPWLELAKDAQVDSWHQHPRHSLAFIVLCDQLPRNIFRGSSDAFAWDHLALAAAKALVDQGHDKTLSWDARAFVYMPFEHSESLLDQHTCVGLFTQMRDEAKHTGDHQLTQQMGSFLQFAHSHRDVIERFGRFPHRNAALGRASSAQEIDYLKQGGGFGH